MLHEQTLQALRDLAPIYSKSPLVANMRQVIQRVREQAEGKVTTEKHPKKREKYIRICEWTEKVLHDFGEELLGILTNPYFQDIDISEILQETQNLSEEDLRIFFYEANIPEEVQKLYSMRLPIDFSRLNNVDSEQKEFIKQRVLRSIFAGPASQASFSRAFLFQAARYMWYWYEEGNKGKNCKTWGIDMRRFSNDIWASEKSIQQNIGWSVVGPTRIADIIDMILFFHDRKTWAWFVPAESQTESYSPNLRKNDIVTNEVSIPIRRYGAYARLRDQGFDVLELNEYEQIEEYYTKILEYISSGNIEANFQQILIYICDFFEFDDAKMYGPNYLELAKMTWVSRTLWDENNHRDRYKLLTLRLLVAIVDRNKNTEKFSECVYSKLKWRLIQSEISERNVWESSISVWEGWWDTQWRWDYGWIYTRNWKSWRQGKVYIEDECSRLWMQEEWLDDIDFTLLQSDQEVVEHTIKLWKYITNWGMPAYQEVFYEVLKSIWVEGEHNYPNIRNQLQEKYDISTEWIIAAYTRVQELNLKYLVRLLVLLKDCNNSKNLD